MARILDKEFKYVPASHTDISKTFERERKRIAAERSASEQDGVAKVTQLKRKTKK